MAKELHALLGRRDPAVSCLWAAVCSHRIKTKVQGLDLISSCKPGCCFIVISALVAAGGAAGAALRPQGAMSCLALREAEGSRGGQCISLSQEQPAACSGTCGSWDRGSKHLPGSGSCR